MGDIMLLGVLRCPFDTRGDIHLIQLQQRCHQAADRIEEDTIKLHEADRLLKENEALREYILNLWPYCNNCQFDGCDSPCDECNRKSFPWKHQNNITILQEG